MSGFVPHRPREYLVIGRPKARAAVRAWFWLASFAIFVGWFRPEWQDSLPVVALLNASIASGIAALVLRIVERPREFVERSGWPPAGPVFF